MKKLDVRRPDATIYQTNQPIVFQASANILMLLTSAVFFALLISGVPLKVATIALLIVVLQILAGGSFLTMFVYKSHLTWKEFCGVGLAIGSLLTFGFDQIFRNTAISGFAWTLPILFLPLSIWRSRLKIDVTIARNDLTVTELAAISATVLLILSPEWFWPLPLALMLIAIVVWREIPRWRKQSAIIAACLIPISILSILKRPIGWWIEDSDVALYEAISRTLGNWGFRDNINGAGTSTNYHWFAYAWSGLIDRVSGSPEWVSNTRTIPLLITVGTVLIIWAILERLSHTRMIIIFSLFAIGGFDTVQTWGRGFKLGIIASPSQMYGLLLLLAFLYVFILDINNYLKKPLPLFFLLAFGVIGSKVAHGAVLAGAVGFFWLANFVKDKKFNWHQTWLTATTILGIATGFYFVINGGGGSSRGILFDQFGFVDGITGDFRPFGLPIQWLAGLTFLFGFLGFQLVGLVALCTFATSSQQKQVQFFAIGIAIAGLLAAMFLSGEFAVELFFTHAASSILVVLIIPIALNRITSNDFKYPRSILSITIFVGLGSAIFANLMPNLDSGSLTAIALRTTPSLVGLLPLLSALACALYLKKNNFEGQFKDQSEVSFFKKITTLALVGLLAMSVGFFSINYEKNIRQEYPESDRNFASRIGLDRPDLQSASNWISTNTKTSAIFATNDLCSQVSKSCNKDTNWDALLDFSMKCTQFAVLRTDKCNAGGYALLTAIVHRRFLAGNYYVGISDGSAIKPWVVKRVIDSVNFAKLPSNETLTALKDSNVGWYLLRRELTSDKNWAKFGNIRYSNSSYFVIELS
jgi:hypothetical protein